ncbi:MAG: patatin-like phospholipase family protein, partial [Clostridia bacterium]|nr:patatin-like phospholipase family protein [Clostridia bacterium]
RAQAVDFYKLPIPFAAVATDLETGEAVILRRGNLASAMRASMAIPGLFEPWLYEGRLLVDGGLVANVPVRIAKELFPGYPVIAVDVSGGLASKDELRSLAGIVGQAITILTRSNVEEDLKFADLVIRPSVNELPLLDFSKVKEAARLGEEAATAAFPELAKLAEKAPSPPEFVAEQPLVSRVAVTGLPSQLER